MKHVNNYSALLNCIIFQPEINARGADHQPVDEQENGGQIMVRFFLF